MSDTYDKRNIVKTYFTIIVLDSCGDEYDEIGVRHCPQDLVGACKHVIELTKHDKELGPEYGTWSYLVCKNEEDDTTNWLTFYKVYKYRGKWKAKQVDY